MFSPIFLENPWKILCLYHYKMLTELVWVLLQSLFCCYRLHVHEVC